MDKLLIAIDPGFDSMKVVIEGAVFKFPFNVEDSNQNRIDAYSVDDDFILYNDEDLGTWLVGEHARTKIFENKDIAEVEDKMSLFYSEDRFLNEEFYIGIKTAVALAIIKHAEFKDVDIDSLLEKDITLIITLPHAIRGKYQDVVTKNLLGKHSFNLKIGNNSYGPIDLDFESDNLYTVSQTIAAIIGETSNDDGVTDDDKLHLLSEGPTLVLDAGYYTTGLVVVSRGGTIDSKKTESNTDYSMKVVNTKVAESLSEIRPDIKHYTIEYLEKEGQGMLKHITEDGSIETINIKSLKDDKINEVAQGLVEYIDAKHNHLLDFNYMILTGGASTRYYDYIEKHYVKRNVFPKENFMLTKAKLFGEDHGAGFAIATGAYKGLRAKFL